MNLDKLLEGPEKEKRKAIIYGGLAILGLHLLLGAGILISKYTGRNESVKNQSYLRYTNQVENRR